MKKTTRIISLILACVCVLMSVPFTAGAVSVTDFKDLDKNADYYEAVEWAIKGGYMTGVSSTSFSPDTILTRAQFATLIARFSGDDLTGYTGKVFEDVSADSWCAGTAAWAYSNGVMSGTSTAQLIFSPDLQIDRQTIAVLIQNYLKYKEIYLEKVTEEVRLMDRGSKRAAAWAADAVEFAYKTDYMQLDSNNCFKPRNLVTRGDAAVILYSLYNAIERTTKPQDRLVVAYAELTSSFDRADFAYVDVLNLHPVRASGNAKTFINAADLKRFPYIKEAALSVNPDMKFVLTVTVNSGEDIEKWLYPYYNCEDFATKIVAMVEEFGFDGVDFDYEFPTGDVPQKNLEYFLTVLRQKLDALKETTQKDYLITMAIAGGVWSFSLFDDLAELQYYVDYFNFMNYDLRISQNYTYNHASTYSNPQSIYRLPDNEYGSLEYDNELTYQTASTYADVFWSLYSGVQREKIVVGAGMYCQRWDDVEGTYDPETGTWCALYRYGDYYEDYSMAYNSTVGLFNYEDYSVPKGGYYTYWDDVAKSMSLYNPETKVFLCLDEDRSVEEKCKMVIDNNIRGIMFFGYNQTCGVGLFEKVDNWLAK